ncbi:MAG: helix-turn-helix domain-containing protein, partial [Caldilineaceae bacterium SB0665_bin_21]|nr:helix-turn-helix domain-containing protein [Caldilineaceae bacterium SB0665_bin_21]
MRLWHNGVHKCESPADTGLSAGHGTGTSMPNSPDSTTQAPDSVHRTVRLRLFPGDAATGILLTAIAGACRYVWNHMLADCEWRYARW